MTTTIGPTTRRRERTGIRGGYRRFARGIAHLMPTGLFARSLIIIIAPVVLLQAAVAFVFMERHWQTVTARLSAAMVADIAAIIEVLDTYPQDAEFAELIRIAGDRLGLNLAIFPLEPLPVVKPKPFFSPLDRAISQEITRQIGKPFWIDTVGRSNLVEIRIQLDEYILRVFARRSQTYSSNSIIFISWMVATSAVLLTIAIVFLRNQIRPILRLTAAVDNFGKGRAVSDFPVRGAREVRQASIAFHKMRRRVERQIDQRTAMLAGVSHDLRTVLTRFKLQLALIEETADVEDLVRDVDDMNRMLEVYLAFARGDTGEDTVATDLAATIDAIGRETNLAGHTVETSYSGDPIVRVRPQAFKRSLTNLIGNANRHARRVVVDAVHAEDNLTITIDDDGPGIPFEEQDAVFKPFYRLDNARKIDSSGTGLGLPIARDIARSHGGDVTLHTSPIGGLRAVVTIPT